MSKIVYTTSTPEPDEESSAEARLLAAIFGRVEIDWVHLEETISNMRGYDGYSAQWQIEDYLEGLTTAKLNAIKAKLDIKATTRTKDQLVRVIAVTIANRRGYAILRGVSDEEVYRLLALLS